MLAHLLACNFRVRTSSRSDMPRPEHVVIDIQPETEWFEALKGVDCVVHLAGIAHKVSRGKEVAEHFFKVNTQGTLNLARQAAKAGVRRFVFVSSIGVNGEETYEKPFSELDVPAPKLPYAWSKLAAEEGLWDLAAQCSMEIVIVRPPLVYGRNAPGNFNKLLRIIKTGMPLPFGGVVANRRSYIGLNNFIDFLEICLTHKKAANQLFLISDGLDLSTSDLLRKMAEAGGQKVHLFYLSVNGLKRFAEWCGKADLARKLLGNLQIDASKARQLLDWSPGETIETGLSQAIKRDDG